MRRYPEHHQTPPRPADVVADAMLLMGGADNRFIGFRLGRPNALRVARVLQAAGAGVLVDRDGGLVHVDTQGGLGR